MVQFIRLLFSLSLVAASFATPMKRTVAQIEADIASISSQVTTLDNDLRGFPASGLVGTLGIHTATTTLANTFNTSISHVQATPNLSEADGTTILNLVLAIEPILLDALSRFTANKASFVNTEVLPIGGIVPLILQDLVNLNTVTNLWCPPMIEITPADLQASATAIHTAINNGFATAIAAYSSS
ncbi:hydrophobic surface binding protein [Mycena pura]|uniref:Hydrophobic surface binding protein n=1 Tax=Mycena pura TaxID=153505 RepID=A0AAD6YA22_9AGAR|nr:hydrophobic surface binding protein [Mycena pura]